MENYKKEDKIFSKTINVIKNNIMSILLIGLIFILIPVVSASFIFEGISALLYSSVSISRVSITLFSYLIGMLLCSIVLFIFTVGLFTSINYFIGYTNNEKKDFEQALDLTLKNIKNVSKHFVISLISMCLLIADFMIINSIAQKEFKIFISIISVPILAVLADILLIVAYKMVKNNEDIKIALKGSFFEFKKSIKSLYSISVFVGVIIFIGVLFVLGTPIVSSIVFGSLSVFTVFVVAMLSVLSFE